MMKGDHVVKKNLRFLGVRVMDVDSINLKPVTSVLRYVIIFTSIPVGSFEYIVDTLHKVYQIVGCLLVTAPTHVKVKSEKKR